MRTRRTGPPSGIRAAILASVLLAGCAASSRSARVEHATAERGWTAVQDVPVVRQASEDGCGAAALAMVLGRWGVEVTEAEVRGAISAQMGSGIRADDLRDAARARGFHAFLVEGTATDLEEELARGRPVVVGTVKRHGRRAYQHYEVVVGIRRDRGAVLTLDPARGPRETRFDRFGDEWGAAGHLTLVVFPR